MGIVLATSVEEKRSKTIEKQLISDGLIQSSTVKLLLLGTPSILYVYCKCMCSKTLFLHRYIRVGEIDSFKADEVRNNFYFFF